MSSAKLLIYRGDAVWFGSAPGDTLRHSKVVFVWLAIDQLFGFGLNGRAAAVCKSTPQNAPDSLPWEAYPAHHLDVSRQASVVIETSWILQKSKRKANCVCRAGYAPVIVPKCAASALYAFGS